MAALNSEFHIAVHSLVFLAYLPSRMASSELLASNICTNPVRIRKVMNLLKTAGLVDVQKGTGGGYILRGNPRQITLGSIYRLTSAGSLVSDWRSGDPTMDCIVASQIGQVMSHIFEGAEEQFERHLDQYTIQDLLNQMQMNKRK
jgi:Rrf2 family protein